MKHEYKVIPAPERARKKRGFKGAALFAHEMEVVINELAAEGWSYLRTDTLPHEERSGLTNKTTTYRNLLVFSRPVEQPVVQTAPPAIPAETQSKAQDPVVANRPERTEQAKAEDGMINLWQPNDGAEDAPSGPDRQR